MSVMGVDIYFFQLVAIFKIAQDGKSFLFLSALFEKQSFLSIHMFYDANLTQIKRNVLLHKMHAFGLYNLIQTGTHTILIVLCNFFTPVCHTFTE
jgi:hypothetical protein